MNGYVAAGYLVTFVTLASYATWVVRRGRQLAHARRREEDVSSR
ncbi:MAG TPA: hypothetical protein VKI20_07245 [Acidimicrobiales bacterium]|nr:hypothetical protein [Acidimicrobiales bacterium]